MISHSPRQAFEVISTHPFGNHYQRLYLKALIDVPLNKAGYAYLFYLNQAQCLVRYYTLRQAWQSYDKTLAYVDVFLHGDNIGSQWAISCRMGDILYIKRQFGEQTQHLHTGQALLIADETSLPTIAHLLQHWHNPITPKVIILWQSPRPADYLILQGISLPIHYLPIRYDVQGSHYAVLIRRLTTLIKTWQQQGVQFDTLWGAVESNLYKALKPNLLDCLALPKEQFEFKVYWKMQ